MSFAITTAIYNALNGDSTLTDNLSLYRSIPAIFSGIQIPDDFAFTRGTPKCAIHLEPAASDVPHSLESKDNVTRLITIDLTVLTEDSESQSLLQTVCGRIRTLLDREDLTITGFNHISTRVMGPYSFHREDHYIIGIITIQLIVAEE